MLSSMTAASTSELACKPSTAVSKSRTHTAISSTPHTHSRLFHVANIGMHSGNFWGRYGPHAAQHTQTTATSTTVHILYGTTMPHTPCCCLLKWVSVQSGGHRVPLPGSMLQQSHPHHAKTSFCLVKVPLLRPNPRQGLVEAATTGIPQLSHGCEPVLS